jgi:recombination protein RecR
VYPKIFQKLIENFSSLPSVGPKMAERLVLFLFKQDKEKLLEFAQNLTQLKNLTHCKKCFNIAEGELCSICANQQREQSAICIVEDSLDIISIERTGLYKGIYHVLGGSLETSSENSELKIPELIQRIKQEKPQEIIIATNPTTEGDLTSLYIKRKLQDFKHLKITRLGRGLSTGSDIEYADEITLGSALTNREKMN